MNHKDRRAAGEEEQLGSGSGQWNVLGRQPWGKTSSPACSPVSAERGTQHTCRVTVSWTAHCYTPPGLSTHHVAKAGPAAPVEIVTVTLSRKCKQGSTQKGSETGASCGRPGGSCNRGSTWLMGSSSSETQCKLLAVNVNPPSHTAF